MTRKSPCRGRYDPSVKALRIAGMIVGSFLVLLVASPLFGAWFGSCAWYTCWRLLPPPGRLCPRMRVVVDRVLPGPRNVGVRAFTDTDPTSTAFLDLCRSQIRRPPAEPRQRR